MRRGDCSALCPTAAGGAGFQHHLLEHLVNCQLTAWHQAGASPLSQLHAATDPVKQQDWLLHHRCHVSRAGGTELPHLPPAPPHPGVPTLVLAALSQALTGLHVHAHVLGAHRGSVG